MRIPQLAIHLDKDIRTKGLTLNKQTHMRPVWTMADPARATELLDAVADEAGVNRDDILAFELMAYDTSPGCTWGWQNEFLASARIDNLISCWAATAAIAKRDHDNGVAVIALFDHEEVGSTSATGADSALLSELLNRISSNPSSHGLDGSLCISADCAHATHPNYPDHHDSTHHIELNDGPVVKVNANQRYATTPLGHALVADACERAGVPHQVFNNHSDLACGSTVGPITGARTGFETVDLGAPQLAMHSANECTGAMAPNQLRRALHVLANPAT